MTDIKTKLTLLLAGICLSLSFTGCDDEPYPPYGPGNGSFLDQNLEGEWELYTVDGQPVYGRNVNYLDFDDDGDGTYYYYQNGREMEEDFIFWCYSYGDDWYLHIDYQYSPDSDMIYWFENNFNYLYLQWWNGNRNVTYCYRYND